ncbi:MAG: lysozyme inhibitor LprI family protein [Armatimonadaceae bacterium]
MRKYRVLLCLFCLLCTGGIVVLAQTPSPQHPESANEKEVHRLDRELEACMEKNPSTAGMVRCIEEARKGWDRELNREYQVLLARLDNAGKQQLRTAQRAWLAYRDQEYKAIAAIYGKTEGTMFVPMRANRAMEITRKRALEIADYNKILRLSNGEVEPER